MESMYQDALNYHIYSVIALMVFITAFYLFTQLTGNVAHYKRRIRLWMPVYIISLAAILFTGAVMMAAKHLAFNMANNLMIALLFFLIFMEIKRHNIFKTLNDHNFLQRGRSIKLMYALELLASFFVTYLIKAQLV